MRFLLIAATAGLLLAGPAAPAFAGGGDEPVTTCPGGICLGVGTPGDPGNSTGGGGNNGGGEGGGSDDSTCTYEPANPSQDTINGIGGQPSGSGGWYWKTCNGVGDGSHLAELVWLRTAPTVSPAVLAQQARAKLLLPSVNIVVSPLEKTLVNLPVWLALAGGWQPLSASASVPGMTVTATARPEKVSFDLGNATSVVCYGPGTVYQPGVHDPYAPSPDCGTVYRWPSVSQPGGMYRITATVTWNVSWSGGGQSGTIAGLTTTGTTTMRVEESQTVID